jgi:hypothetical protein
MAERMRCGHWSELPDDQFAAKLKDLHRRDTAAPDEHPLRREGDPGALEFAEAVGRGISQDEHRRWGDSPYCARLLKLHWREEPPSAATLLAYKEGTLAGFEAAAMAEHLGEPEGRLTRLLLRSAGLGAEGLAAGGGDLSAGSVRAGDVQSLLATLRRKPDGAPELSLQSRDASHTGGRCRVELIGEPDVLSWDLTLEALGGRGAAVTSPLGQTWEELVRRLGNACCLVVTHIDR